MLEAVREREPGETILAAFRRFVLKPRGALARQGSPEADEQLKAITRVITDSPALLAREQRIFERYTTSLGQLIADEARTGAGDIEPWVVANALIGVHRGLIVHVRRATLAETPSAQVARETRRQGERAFAALEHGFASYGPKAAPSADGQAKLPSTD